MLLLNSNILSRPKSGKDFHKSPQLVFPSGMWEPLIVDLQQRVDKVGWRMVFSFEEVAPSGISPSVESARGRLVSTLSKKKEDPSKTKNQYVIDEDTKLLLS